MARAPVAVILVHWNQPERCGDALAAWRAQTVPVEVTIVDNASEPEFRARLGEVSGGDVTLIDSGSNLGFGPGANVGWRRFLADADAGEWSVIAPHDALPAPDCLARMLSELDVRPETGLACADVGDDHTPVVDPFFGGMFIPVPGVTAAWGTKAAADRDAPTRWEPVGYPHGTLLMARRACLDDIGLFDERYFSYCEEADLGVRARAAGWDVALIRGAEVRNPNMGGGNAAVDYLMLRNTLMFLRTHFGRYNAFIRILMALNALAKGVLRPSKRPWLFVPRAQIRAIVDYSRGVTGPPPSDLSGPG